tara:strand:- start:112 stop:612 length:501 start_codon:yes stop_codon:yes gene_type:complete
MPLSDLIFRAWYYFRNGWSLYFAFIFAAINTLTVTYFLAIDNYPFLQAIFPTFPHYVVILSAIAIPLLVVIGYVHWKRSGARKAEIDINYEVDPYRARTLVNSELILKINLNLIQLTTKLASNEKLSSDDMEKIKTLQNELETFIDKRTMKNKLDLKYLRTETQEK